MFFSENLTYPGFVEYTLRALLLIKEGFGMKKIFHRTEKAFTVACHAENTKQTIKNILHPLNFSAFQDDFNEKCKDAFTLAETLTTLLVIGIVASLTIPSLMANYKERQFASAKKKAMSTLINGYRKMMAEEGTEFSAMNIFDCGQDFNCYSEIHKKIFQLANEKSKTNDGLPASYQQASDSEAVSFDWNNVPYIFTTADGMTNGFVLDEGKSSFSVVVDLNGVMSPNKVSKDLVKFRINKGGEITEVTSELDSGGSGCSAENLDKCKTDADIKALYQSGMSVSDLKTITLSDGSCLIMAKSPSYYYSDFGRGGLSDAREHGYLNSEYSYVIIPADSPNWQDGYCR